MMVLYGLTYADKPSIVLNLWWWWQRLGRKRSMGSGRYTEETFLATHLGLHLLPLCPIRIVRFVVCQTLYRTGLTGFSVLITFYDEMVMPLWTPVPKKGKKKKKTFVYLGFPSINRPSIWQLLCEIKSHSEYVTRETHPPPPPLHWNCQPHVPQWCSVHYCCWIITALLISPSASSSSSWGPCGSIQPVSPGAKSILCLVVRFVERFNKSQMFMSFPPKPKHLLHVVMPC